MAFNSEEPCKVCGSKEGFEWIEIEVTAELYSNNSYSGRFEDGYARVCTNCGVMFFEKDR